MVCNSFRNWSFWCCKFTSFNYSIRCQVITFWSFNFSNDVFITQDVLNSEFTISIWFKLTNDILVSFTDNLEFSTLQWSTVFVYFFHFNAKFVTDTSTTSDLDVDSIFCRRSWEPVTCKLRFIFNSFPINSSIVYISSVFYWKVVCLANVTKVNSEWIICYIYGIVRSNILLVFKSPFTVSVFPSTFEDSETIFTVRDSFWLKCICKNRIFDFWICSVNSNTVT